ncbi:MAG TPA: bifunctional indole-3-glycerol-phosphate synthase TrpC/phosphoribosylanthranilate isomerase TrpF [Sphingomicrobium sp.]|nr:bifunctional indole-3-glycerol-phosphate synthase TrpC/phosphoribosylanthranilate isomerase TrpF [Sphingomicrobium sp.]
MSEPSGLLGEIAAAKRAELAARFDGVSLDALRARAPPAERSLAAAVGRPGARFILEIKKASPSAGPIRPGADPAEIALGYAGVADALSVLTDGTSFGGSIGDLAAARSAFDGPILAKDFVLDPRQVAEARLAGADAVLVMLSLLDDRSARLMIAEAHRLGMEALVEVHDEAEMGRALALDALLIGINNRDLRDLSVDLSTTERLAGLAPGRLVISESGIACRGDVERLSPNADGFLVGSALMQAGEPAEAARALVFGRVKLCGVNRAEDLEAGRAATHAGLVFVPESPRAVTLDQARSLAGGAAKAVGVFRDAPVRTVAEAAVELGLAAVQLHGDEDSDTLRALRSVLPAGCEIWKAVTVDGTVASDCDAADRLLFDSGRGGTGRTFDWTLVRGHPALGRSFVAGGIGPDNARAASRLGTYGLDVGSGIDALPGLKSADKIRALFEALRPKGRQELRQCA